MTLFVDACSSLMGLPREILCFKKILSSSTSAYHQVVIHLNCISIC
jgi:hypothetical protein